LGPRSRVRGAPRIDLEVELILQHNHARRYLKVKRIPRPEHTSSSANQTLSSRAESVVCAWLH